MLHPSLVRPGDVVIKLRCASITSNCDKTGIGQQSAVYLHHMRHLCKNGFWDLSDMYHIICKAPEKFTSFFSVTLCPVFAAVIKMTALYQYKQWSCSFPILSKDDYYTVWLNWWESLCQRNISVPSICRKIKCQSDSKKLHLKSANGRLHSHDLPRRKTICGFT